MAPDGFSTPAMRAKASALLAAASHLSVTLSESESTGHSWSCMLRSSELNGLCAWFEERAAVSPSFPTLGGGTFQIPIALLFAPLSQCRETHFLVIANRNGPVERLPRRDPVIRTYDITIRIDLNSSSSAGYQWDGSRRPVHAVYGAHARAGGRDTSVSTVCAGRSDGI
jgi:hypothetical protein